MAERKLDIFQLLSAMDRNDGNWFSRQSADAKKEFSPPVAVRWASAVNDGPEALYTLWMVNERVNLWLFDLYKHPELIYRLMASCGLGKPLRHQWIAPAKRKSETNKAFELLASCHPEANERELQILMSLYTRNTFSQLVDECGIQSNETKEILKAFDKVKTR